MNQQKWAQEPELPDGVVRRHLRLFALQAAQADADRLMREGADRAEELVTAAGADVERRLEWSRAQAAGILGRARGAAVELVGRQAARVSRIADRDPPVARGSKVATDPAAALALCEELGVAPQRCGLIGDAADDLAMAQGAGLAWSLAFTGGWSVPLKLQGSHGSLASWAERPEL